MGKKGAAKDGKAAAKAAKKAKAVAKSDKRVDKVCMQILALLVAL